MKDFLLITNKNCITYKNVFPLIKDNKIRLGHNNIKEFVMNDGTSKLFGNIGWITTLHTPDKPKLILTKRYTPEEYPKYDNYDAINVDRLKDIPYDYDGVMGVPITILEKDLENVEIYECLTSHGKEKHMPILNGKDKYARILMKIVGIANDKRLNEDWVVKGTPTYIDDKHKNFQGMVVNGKQTYARVLIKKNFEIIKCCEPALPIDKVKTLYPSRQIKHNGKLCQKTYHRVLIRRKEE